MTAVEVRALSPDDHDAIRAIWHAALNAGQLSGFNASDLDLLVERCSIHPHGICVATGADGVLGFLHLDAHIIVVGAEFRRRGVGRALVDFTERDLRDTTGDRLLLWLPPDSEGAAGFYAALGMRHHASLWQLDLPANHNLPSAHFPADLVTQAVDEVDLDEYVALFNTAFADHPTPLRITCEIVDWARTRPEYNPTMTLMLADRSTGALVGLCRTAHDRGPGEAGEVKFIGLLPEWRGRGIGKALLAWGVKRLHDAGAVGVSLNVESENDGALGLYEQMGFERTREWRRFARG